MIDFRKKLAASSLEKKLNPIEIYDSLDRASDKGRLRPAQEAVLKDWFENHRADKEAIIKLHTGQGKTLVGLLMLQSKLNEGKGPVLYLCPNKYLVDQTCEQAKQFGVKFSRVDKNNQIPQDFWESKAILITVAQMMFNGLTKFGLRHRSHEIDSIVLDDSHACIDTIQDAFTIKISKNVPAYNEIIALFESDLEGQGEARLAEIKNGEYDAFLPVPYWAWQEKQKEIIAMLIKHKNAIDGLPYNHQDRKENNIVFAWELDKDVIKDCQCIISGNSIEIFPYYNPIDLFGSFHNAKHRIFMSATTNNDSFFIKGLGLSHKTIKNPIKYEQEKWSGEKMILIPYLMHDHLNRVEIVNQFSKPNEERKYGVVALTPSVKAAEYWEECGAIKSDTTSIESQIKLLKEGDYTNTVVIANRYDGIDLPDDMCRILIVDSKPYAMSLSDRHQESCRADSKVIDVKVAQKIEQGLGRGVRGEKDYCVILLTGDDLISTVRTKKLSRYFSSQTNKQIEIGFESTEFGVKEVKSNDGFQLLIELIKPCLNRDEGWKSFYNERMDTIESRNDDNDLIKILELEKQAEERYVSEDYEGAIAAIQTILDNHILVTDKEERGWYLQEMARYAYNKSKIESSKLQITAYKTNRYLLKPTNGVEFQKLKINKGRIENIKSWVEHFDSFEELKIQINEITSNLAFGVKADKFEQALCETGKALGFASERPDKEHKKGPDNLWNIRADEYILFECKNEVEDKRSEINKHETGQMNVSCAWFKENYSGETVKNIMIIPTKDISAHGAFTQKVEILRKGGLNKLTKNIRKFFDEFKDFDIQTLTEKQINDCLNAHNLSVENILHDYTDKPFQKR